MIKYFKLFSIGIGYTISVLACPFLALSAVARDFESGIIFLCISLGFFLLAEGIRKTMMSENDAS
jgi:hypothetical protein